MSCQCEIYEICKECAPSQEYFLKAVRDHDEAVSRHQSLSSKSYTLRDLWTLAKEYADNADGNLGMDDTRLRLELSLFLTWLEGKEKIDAET